MTVVIRPATEPDYAQVFALIEQAFRAEEYSDHREQFLVERLRHSPAFVPELSLVAEAAGKVVGYILLTRIHIQSGADKVEALALAPVAVAPELQHQGIGGRLIQEGHLRAHRLGFSSVILLGHAGYYPRFGYRPARQFGIRLPFDVPAENCMALELRPDGLRGVHGEVLYSPPFYE